MRPRWLPTCFNDLMPVKMCPGRGTARSDRGATNWTIRTRLVMLLRRCDVRKKCSWCCERERSRLIRFAGENERRACQGVKVPETEFAPAHART